VRSRVSVVAATLAAFLLPAAAFGTAQDCKQLVYWPLVSDGAEYRRVGYPVEAGELRVLADTDFVLEARQACVRYWPITREYLADVSEGSPAPSGRVEIINAAGEPVGAVSETYILWHPRGVGAGPAALVRGEDAKGLYADYVREARLAAERARQYERLTAEHQAAVEAWLRIAAERPSVLPKPPPEFDLRPPEPYQAYASKPRAAMVASLPPGNYAVRVIAEGGKVVRGSERRLVSFAPLDESVGYVLRPEDRWTQPIVSFSRGETIYTTGGVDLFLQPVPVVEYDARDFARLFRPQTVESTDASRTVWVPHPGNAAMIAGAALAISKADAAATLPVRPYRVRQLPGAARGYEIEEFTPRQGGSLSADFDAIRLSGDRLPERIGLTATGTEVGGSGREIRLVAMPAEAILFLPALLPAGIGLALRFYARSKSRSR
jgi:hypothetical protein